MTLYLIAILACAAFLFVVAPLFEPIQTKLNIFQENSTTALDAIEDLDLEYASGKVSEEGYKAVRSELVKDAALSLAKTQSCGHCRRCKVPLKSADLFCGNCGERATS